MTRSIRCSATSAWRSSSPPSVADVTRLGPALERLGVDEADEIEPVFGVQPDLAGDELADLAGPDDDRAHCVPA